MRIVLRPWIVVVYFSPVFAKAIEAERARRVLLSRKALGEVAHHLVLEDIVHVLSLIHISEPTRRS
eukprot:1210280-Prymnesium_polylepis.1